MKPLSLSIAVLIIAGIHLAYLPSVVVKGEESGEVIAPVFEDGQVRDDARPNQSAVTDSLPSGADRSKGRKTSKREASPAAHWLDPIRDEPAGTRYQTFYSQTLKQSASYQIYFPPGYAADEQKRYPVVYWLHGLGGNQRLGASFIALLNAAIQEGRAPAMLVVLVNGMRDRFYCDSLNGDMPVETVIIQDLIPEVDKTHRTIARREARVIEGSSMGGFGALYLGLKYPEVFGVVSSVMAGIHDETSIAEMYPDAFRSVYGGSREYFQANSPWTLAEKHADVLRGRTYIRMWIGGADLEWRQKCNANFHELLSRLKIDHEYRVIPGVAHKFIALYEKMGEANWAFYRLALAD